MKNNLFDHLSKYNKSDFYPFHMPGHKRNPQTKFLSEICGYDITEIDGFDNLHNPEGILKEAQNRAAALYGAEETYYLINGSTVGILSAISTVANRGRKLIIARNCHKAVYHAAFLNRLELEYIYPELMTEYQIYNGVSAEEVEQKIQEIAAREQYSSKEVGNLIAGIVITSPSYEGILSDVKEIIKTAHRYGIPVIVDQAHGAHFGMHPGFPQNAVREGADIVIHSVHKTLPAPTQTALIHRNGTLTDGFTLKKYLSIYQTSSPSYLLMAGIDEGISLTQEEGEEKLSELLAGRKKLLAHTKGLRYIKIYPAMGDSAWECSQAIPKDIGGSFKAADNYTRQMVGIQEPGKLVILARGCTVTGKELYDILREKYHLQMEMAAGGYVVAVLTMMDREEGYHRLAQALREIDEQMTEQDAKDGRDEIEIQAAVAYRPREIMKLSDAFTSRNCVVPFEEGIGKIAAEFINLYPPGVPLVVPGEELEEDCLRRIIQLKKRGYNIQGMSEDLTVRVIASF